LMSMAVALYEFGAIGLLGGEGASAEAGARQIIRNFGIALATTIAGIFLRVLLNQMRVDPADVERTTRMELADAATKLKAHLDTVSQGMARHTDEMLQRANDQSVRCVDMTTSALDGVTRSVATRAEEMLQAMTSSASAAVREIADAER